MEKFYSRFASKKLLIVLLSFICVGSAWATDVSGDTSTLWTKDNSPYNIVGTVTVPFGKTLIIEPGVTVNFPTSAKNSQLIINGVLKAQGGPAPSDSIFFTGGTNYIYSGWQRGPITFNGTLPSILQYVSIYQLGYEQVSDAKAAIIVNSSSVIISNCTIRSIRSTGIEVKDIKPTKPSITDNVFADNLYYDVILDVDKLRYVKNNKTFADNSITPLKFGLTSDVVMAANDTLTVNNNSALTTINVEYTLLATQTIPTNKTLVIQPEVTVNFPPAAANSQLIVNGTLKAQGTDTKYIYFTGGTNYIYSGWQRGPINFTSLSKNSVLKYVIVDMLGYEQNNDGTAAVIVNTPSCNIDSCFIQNIRGTGIEINNISPLKPIVTDNYIQANSNLDAILDVDKLRYLSGNNALRVGLTHDFPMSFDDTLTANNISYKLLANQTIPETKTLVIEPTVNVLFPPSGANTQIIVDGTLRAQGDVSNSIYFTGGTSYIYSGWQRGPVTFSSSSTNSILQYVIVDMLGYEQSYLTKGVIDINSSSCTIANCYIQNSRSAAISIQNVASPLIAKTCITNNSGGVVVTNGSAKFFECNFSSNISFGLKDNSTTDSVYADSCFWGNSSGPREPILNPTGGGDIVSGNVVYLPFSTTQFDCSEPYSILPLTLLDFQTTLSNNAVNCTWQTATETNTSYFIIQRSTDGANFSSLGKVYASGNSSSNKSYSFTDKSPNNGINYYRLQMVDKDGRYSYSKTLPVNISIKQPFTIYPNPVKDVLYVQVQRSVAEQVSLRVIDMQGKTISQQSRQLAAGVTTLSVNTTSLARGSYFVVIKGQTTEKKLFIKE